MIELSRTYRPLSTISDCFYNDEKICVVLERPWMNNENDKSCVPEGIYTFEPHRYDDKLDTFVIVNHDLDVGHWEGEAKRFCCAVHPITHVSGLEGCLGPGLTEFKPDSVGYSSDATSILLDLIRVENITKIKISS